jgi:hypothetical protein
VVANTSKVTLSIPEFGPISGMIVTIFIIECIMLSRRTLKYN